MGEHQIHAPGEKPVQIEQHVRHGEGPLPPLRPAAAEALIGAARPSPVEGGGGGTERLCAFRPLQRQAILRRDPAPYQILPGNVEVLLQRDVVRMRGMTGQRDAVGVAPGLNGRIERLPQPQGDQPVIGAADALRLRAGVQPERGQVAERQPHLGQHGFQPVRPCPHLRSHASPGGAGLVHEDGPDGRAEVAAHRGPVALVGQAKEAPHGLRVQDVRGAGSVRHAVVLVLMNATDGAAGEALQEGDGALARQRLFVRAEQPCARRVKGILPSHAERQAGNHALAVPGRYAAVPQRDAPGGEGRVLPHHLSVGGAGGVHALVVEHHPHAQRRRLPHREGHQRQKALRQIGQGGRDADARMQHHPPHAVMREIPELPRQLLLPQIAVEKPEGHRGKLVTGMQKALPELLKHGHRLTSAAVHAAVTGDHRLSGSIVPSLAPAGKRENRPGRQNAGKAAVRPGQQLLRRGDDPITCQPSGARPARSGASPCSRRWSRPGGRADRRCSPA